MTPEEKIKSYAFETGLDAVAVTAAVPSPNAVDRLRNMAGDHSLPVQERDRIRSCLSRCSPGEFLRGARSVVVAAECYLTSEPPDLSTPGDPHGLVARYTWRNYYRDTRERLKRVAEFLGKEFSRDARTKVFSNKRMSEKPLAEMAGLGYYGKHGIVIVPGYGSLVVLGELLTDLELREDAPLADDCGECRLCIDACPTGALHRPYVVDRSLCIQALTNSIVVLSVPVREAWGKRLYGCSTCQEACPVNGGVAPVEKRHSYGEVGSSVPLLPLLNMTDVEYYYRFRGNQMGSWWIHPEAMRRNACIALGHSGDPVAVGALAGAMMNPDVIVRVHAAWALGKIGDAGAGKVLEASRSREDNVTVRAEIESALAIL